MEYTNQEILSAVLARWIRPLMNNVMLDKISSSLPFLTNLEAKVKSTGWVSSQWTVGKELTPFISGMSEKILTPIIYEMVRTLPEESIPSLAHGFVENATRMGHLDILEGMISFDLEDMQRLQYLLDHNLPLTGSECYVVVE